MQTIIVIALGIVAVLVILRIAYLIWENGSVGLTNYFTILGILVAAIGIVVLWPNQPSTQTSVPTQIVQIPLPTSSVTPNVSQSPSPLPTKPTATLVQSPSALPTATRAAATSVPSPTQPPTAPPKPIFTPTPLPIPSGYIVLDQFDDRAPIENNWEVIGKTGNCLADKQNGYLHMECSESKKGSYWLEYVSRKDNMRQLSGGTLSGIAMSTKMIGQNQDTKVKVHFVIQFASADGKTSSRAYFMDMRSNNIRIAESYPLQSWTDGGSTLIPIDSTVFHVIQVEYRSNQLKFFIDGKPIELNFHPDLPNGFTWQDWTFE